VKIIFLIFFILHKTDGFNLVVERLALLT